MIVLEIGCGKEGERAHSWPGPTITVDNDPEVGADVTADVLALPFEDNYADAVLASHIIEHLFYRTVPSALREWLRVLKPGGHLYLFTPDLGWAAQEIVEGRFNAGTIAYIYGSEVTGGQCHHCLFTQAALEQLLTETGFQVARSRCNKRGFAIRFDRRYDVPDVEVVGKKP